MVEDIKIEFLEDNRHLIPILEESYKNEWKEYYGSGGHGDALSDLNSFCNNPHASRGTTKHETPRGKGHKKKS
jgi:hypothetical protein